jgi:hypothetical protein
LNELGVIFFHGNPLSKIDLSPLPSTIKRVGINKNYELINADHLIEKITYETEPRTQIIYEYDQAYQEDYGYEEDFVYPGVYERSPNDQRFDCPENGEQNSNRWTLKGPIGNSVGKSRINHPRNPEGGESRGSRFKMSETFLLIC